MPTETNAENYKEYYTQQLKEATEYQDYICQKLHTRGIVLQNMTSKKYQYKRENLLGLEIKYDKRFADTGRLYIETHEKSNPCNQHYVESGIYRDDHCWLFGIGDHDVFYIFSKSQLRRLDEARPSWLYIPQPTGTSRGFCVPEAHADIIAALRVSLKEIAAPI